MTVPASSLLAVLPGASASPTGAGAAAGDLGGGAFDGLLANLMAGTGEGGAGSPGAKAAARPGRPDSDRVSTEDLALDAAAAQMLLAPPGALPIIYAPTVPLSTAGMATEPSPVQGGGSTGEAISMAPPPATVATGPAPTSLAATGTATAGPGGEAAPAAAGMDNAIIVPPALAVGAPATATPGRAAPDPGTVAGEARDGQAAAPGRPVAPVAPVAPGAAAPPPAEPVPVTVAAPAPAGQAAPAARPDASPRPVAELAVPAPAAATRAVPADRAPAPAPAPTAPIAAPPPVAAAAPPAPQAAAIAAAVSVVAEPAAATAPVGVPAARDPATPAAAARRDNGRQPAGAERGGRTADSAAAPTAVRSAGPAFVAPSNGTLAGLDANSETPLAAADPLTVEAADAGDDRAPVPPVDVRAAGGLATIPDSAPAVRGAPETVARLAADIVRRLEGQSTRFDLQLDPHGLGKVDVAIEIDRNGKLTAALSFDSPQTAAELRGRAGELRLALEQAGFDLSESSLTFDTAGQGAGAGGREAGQQQDRAWNGRAFQRVQSGLDEADLTLAATPTNPARRTRSGVDIRI